MGRASNAWSWVSAAALVAAALPVLHAGDWPSWRGPEQNGASRESGLPAKWSPSGENLLWKAAYGGRSTPVVMNGRVYLLNRVGSGKTEQERLLCIDAESGHVHWEYRFGVFLTDVPPSCVGWASPTADPETGHVYALGVQGTFICVDRDGKLLWQRALHEEYGMLSDHRGRTCSPVVDGALVIASFLGASWGATQGKIGHRYAAFEKRTGAVVWWSEPGGKAYEPPAATPVIATINGQRLLIDAGADGAVHAIKVRTGEKVWDFQLSRRALSASIVVWKTFVIAVHGEENLDSASCGRVVCIDATGTGDVTKTNEVWRVDGVLAGSSSPAMLDGRLYVADNAAKLHAIDAATGRVLWRHSVGTALKASPVVVDGKIFLGILNSRFCILQPSDSGCEVVCEVTFPSQDGTVVDLNGSAAIANGRIYFATRDELYCIGFRSWSGGRGALPETAVEDDQGASSEAPSFLQVTPGDVVLQPGQAVIFSARLFDARGRFLRDRDAKASWAARGLKGTVSDAGKLIVAQDVAFGAGTVEARFENLTGEARVRVVPAPPLHLDFNEVDEGKAPMGWVGAGGRFVGAVLGGEKVLRKVTGDAKLLHAETFFGLPTWKNYTMQADVLGVERRRNLPNITLINSGYQLMLLGNAQKVRLVSWIPRARIDQAISFPWRPEVWYTMKLSHDPQKGIVRGKVWPRSEAEPDSWALEIQDPAPLPSGGPGIQAYSAGQTARSSGAEIYFDNIQVIANDL